eukprot:3763372-Pyramimonas_sp.AAC.1
MGASPGPCGRASRAPPRGPRRGRTPPRGSRTSFRGGRHPVRPRTAPSARAAPPRCGGVSPRGRCPSRPHARTTKGASERTCQLSPGVTERYIHPLGPVYYRASLSGYILPLSAIGARYGYILSPN